MTLNYLPIAAILSTGILAFSIVSLSIIISPVSFSKQSNIFGSVIFFIWGHILHGLTKSTFGFSIWILSLIEHSVTIITFFGWLSFTYFIIPDVDPAKSLASITSGGHSGCAIILIPGLFFLISSISFLLNWSWTIQIPFHEIISTSVWEATYLAR